jgi:hypothetical protein
LRKSEQISISEFLLYEFDESIHFVFLFFIFNIGPASYQCIMDDFLGSVDKGYLPRSIPQYIGVTEPLLELLLKTVELAVHIHHLHH